MKWIKDFELGDLFRGPLLIANATKGTMANGQVFLSLSLQDKTGTIEGKRWEVSDEELSFLVPGNIVYIDGDVTSYRDNLQLKILHIKQTNEGEFDASNFTSSSPLPLDELKKKLDYYLNSIKDEDIKLITEYLVKKYYDDFLVYPAAVRLHHEFVSGLIHHTLQMCDLAEAIVKIYDDVNRDLLIAGVLLHDLGKTIELSGPIIPKYTIEGKLVGHISITHAEIQIAKEKLKITSEAPMLLSHLVLSHHGKYEYGSPVLPMIKEAVLLNLIDDLDAKMAMLDKAYDLTNEGEFTSRLFAFEDRSFYKIKKDNKK